MSKVVSSLCACSLTHYSLTRYSLATHLLLSHSLLTAIHSHTFTHSLTHSPTHPLMTFIIYHMIQRSTDPHSIAHISEAWEHLRLKCEASCIAKQLRHEGSTMACSDPHLREKQQLWRVGRFCHSSPSLGSTCCVFATGTPAKPTHSKIWNVCKPHASAALLRRLHVLSKEEVKAQRNILYSIHIKCSSP